ncbi:MAG: VOC family protein [Treponema sp.]|nr:VOC family protein [Treponema sp.]
MLIGIGHNAINVLDMEKSLDFYVNAVGFQRAFELPLEGRPWIVYLKIGPGAFLELFYGGVKDRDQNYAADLIGYHHWGIACTNLPALRDRLFKKGCIPQETVPDKTSGGGYKLWIHDPDGNALELVQPKPTEAYGGRDELLGIHHIGLVCHDVAKSVDFYCNKLGLEEIGGVEQDGHKGITALKVREGQCYKLFAPQGGERTRPNTWQSYGSSHVSLQVDNVEETVEKLRGKGVTIDIEPKTAQDKNTQAWIHDPDGNRVELMYIHPESPQATH